MSAEPLLVSPESSTAERAGAGWLWMQVATPLATATAIARSLRARHAGDAELASQLDDLIDRLDDAFASMTHGQVLPQTNGNGRPKGRGRKPKPNAGSRDARALFDRWVGEHCPEHVSGTDRSRDYAPDELLNWLSSVAEPVPAATSGALGLDRSASYAWSARLLRWARSASDGPQCRSYRSALYFLGNADGDVLSARKRLDSRQGPA